MNGEYMVVRADPLAELNALCSRLHDSSSAGSVCYWECLHYGLFPAAGRTQVVIYACTNNRWYVRAQLGGDVSLGFEKEYDHAPDCEHFSGERLECVTPSVGNCNGEGAYVLLSAIRREALASDCCIAGPFAGCYAPRTPGFFELTIEGMIGGLDCRCTADECSSMNGTYLLACGATCDGTGGGGFYRIRVDFTCIDIKCLEWNPDTGFLTFRNSAGTSVYAVRLKRVTDGLCDSFWQDTYSSFTLNFVGERCTGDRSRPALPFTGLCFGSIANPGPGNAGLPSIRFTVRGAKRPCA